MTRQQLDRHQVWLYFGAIVIGLGLGGAAPALVGFFEAILWPTLGLLLYATFTQVPLTHLPDAFRDRRFMGTVLFSNFVVVPVAVWLLLAFVPSDPAVQLGVLLVLLVPCTDWFITFTHLGGGDTRRAIAVTPAICSRSSHCCPVICGCSWARASRRCWLRTGSRRYSWSSLFCR